MYCQHPQTWSCLQETCLAFNLTANIGLYCEGFYCLDIDNEIPHMVEDAMLAPEMNFTSRPPMLPSTDTLNDSELSSLVRNKDDTLYKLAWCLNSCQACDIQARDGDIYCSEHAVSLGTKGAIPFFNQAHHRHSPTLSSYKLQSQVMASSYKNHSTSKPISLSHGQAHQE
jgi:hypothetical protein